jgi:hypothetical protein
MHARICQALFSISSILFCFDRMLWFELRLLVAVNMRRRMLRSREGDRSYGVAERRRLFGKHNGDTARGGSHRSTDGGVRGEDAQPILSFLVVGEVDVVDRWFGGLDMELLMKNGNVHFFLFA